MPPGKPDAGSDFASVLSKATSLPSLEELGKDLPDGFPLGAGKHHRIVEEGEGIPGVVAYDYFIHRKGFVIYRPWDNCSRCTGALASGAVSLPDEGDISCPHTAISEYKRVVDEILSGKLIFGSEQELVQKDGSIVISLRWYEAKASAKKKVPTSNGGIKQKEEPPL